MSRNVSEPIVVADDEGLLEALTAALYKELARRLRAGKPSIELLGVVRSLLKDTGTGPVSEADQRALRTIHRLFVKALVAGLKEHPSAAVLSEARHYLMASGWTVKSATVSEEMKQLKYAAMPFGGPGRRH